MPDVHFLLCGLDINWKHAVGGMDRCRSIRDRCSSLGLRRDVARLFAGMDIATTASISGEAFPLGNR